MVQLSNAGATGHIPFMDFMLADFRSFCRNENNRLRNFWDESWLKKMKFEQSRGELQAADGELQAAEADRSPQ